MVDENKEEKELAKMGEKVAEEIKELAKAQKKGDISEKKEAKAEKKEAIAMEGVVGALENIASATRQQAKATVEAGKGKPEKKPFLSGVISAGSGIKNTLSKAMEGSALVIAALNYAANWWLGFLPFFSSRTVALLDVITLTLLLGFARGTINKTFVLSVFATFAIKIFSPYTPFFGGVLVLVPWWLLFVAFFEGGFDFLFATKPGIVALIFVLVLVLAPLYQQSFMGVTFEGKAKADELATKISNYLKESFASLTSQIGKTSLELKCTTNPELPECKELAKKQEGTAKIYVDSKLPLQFAFQLAKFDKERSYSEQYTQFVSAVNALPNPVTMRFSCEIEDFEKGTADPPSLTVEQGQVVRQSVNCNFKDKWKQGTTKNFNFKTTLENIESKAEKELFFMDKKSLDTILDERMRFEDRLDKTKINSEILKSEYGSYIQPSLIGGQIITKTSDEFLIASIQEEEGAANPSIQSMYIYGVDANQKIPLKIYLQKNKKGDVIKINSINIKLPPGLQLDVPNCGYDSAYLETINWTKALRITGEEGQYDGLKSCNILFTEMPNVPTLKAITVTINYDFELTETAEVQA